MSYFYMVFVALGLIVIAYPISAMEEITPSEIVISDEGQRQKAIEDTLALLDNHLHTLKTAYTLCYQAAHTLLGSAEAPLSNELMDDAKTWMWNTVHFSSPNWPEGTLENREFLVVHFFHATNRWLEAYEEIMGFRNFLSFSGTAAISRFYFGLEGYLEGKKNERRGNANSDLERALLVDSMTIDYNAMEYEQLSAILPILKPLADKQDLEQGVVKHQIEKKAEALRKEHIQKIADSELALWETAYAIIGNQFYINKNVPKYQLGNENTNKALKALKICKTPEKRSKFVADKFNKSFDIFMKLFRERTVGGLQPIKAQEENIIDNSVQDKDESPKQTSTNKSKKKKKGKKGARTKNKNNKAARSLPQNQNFDGAKKDLEPVKEATEAEQGNEALSPVIPIPDPLMTKNEEPDDERYEWNEELQKAEFQKFEAAKQAKIVKEEVKKESSFPWNPYLSQEVVEKFLDILGNQKGELRKKKMSSTHYIRQGWGSISDFQNTLLRAGWLNNQIETQRGVKNAKHASSTISFRMPNSQKSFNAPIIKFHDDHGVSGQDMREITRHFIRESLYYFGYTEEFLLAYYDEFFSVRK